MTEETLAEGTSTETEAATKKKRGRKPATESTPKFTEKDLADFKEWQAQRGLAKTTTVTADAPEDDKLYRMWKEESRLVKGVFRCREPEGGSVTFPFRKYKWDQTKWYTLVDGETYEIPLAVARHLNANCSYPVHSHILGPDGKQTVDTKKVKSRMNFESLDFAA